VDDDDGIFWMSFDDLMKNFSSVNVCMVRVNGIHPSPWYETRKQFYFELINNNKDNFFASSLPPDTTSSDVITSTNTISQPKFSLTDSTCISSFFQLAVNEDNVKMYFTLHQQDKRCLDSPPYIDMGFIILLVKKPHRNEGEYSLKKEDYELVYDLGWKLNSRQNQSEEVLLNKGQYLIIPFSTGCKLKQYYEENPEIVTAIKANMAKMNLDSTDISSSTQQMESSSSLKDTEPIAAFSLGSAVVPLVSTSSVPPPAPFLRCALPTPTSPVADKVSVTTGPILDFTGDTVKFTPYGTAVYTDLFHQLDKDHNSYLTCNEFAVYWKITTDKPLFPNFFNTYILRKYGGESGTGGKELGLNGFLAQQLDTIQERKPLNSHAKLEETIQNEIKKLLATFAPAPSSTSSTTAAAVLPPSPPIAPESTLHPHLLPDSSAVPAPPLVTVNSPPMKGRGDVTPPKAPETVKVASSSTFEATKGVSASTTEGQGYQPLNFGRSAVLSIHSTSERYSVETSPYNESIYHLAEEFMILANGKCTHSYAKDQIHLYEVNLGYDGVSVMFENANDSRTLSIAVDLTGSQNNNILTHRNTFKYETIIKPHEKALMFHIMPKQTLKGWSTEYGITYTFK
jgi:hypothetical protein